MFIEKRGGRLIHLTLQVEGTEGKIRDQGEQFR